MAGESAQHPAAEAKSRHAADPPPGPLLTWPDVAILGVVMLITLIGYVLTLAPGLLQADSGELQTLAVTLGYAHPTGYPVYLLLAKAATAIPVGEVPYRVNLLSAVMGAVAVGMMYLLGRLLVDRRWVPLAGAVALAFSPTFWSEAIIAEVYTCGVVCTLGVLLGLGLWQKTGNVRWLFAAACLGGVSLGVHATVAFMAPAALLFVALHPRRWKANWTAATAGATAGVLLTLVAYAVIDAADSPCSYFRTVIDPSRTEWDLKPEDTDDFLERVKLSLSAPQFQGMLFSQTPARTWEKTLQYAANLPREFPPLWLAAAVAGLAWLARRNWKMTLLLGLTFVTHLVYDLQFDGIVHVMYISTYVPIAVFGMAGFTWAGDVCGKSARRSGKERPSAAALDRVWAIVGVGVVVYPMLFPDAWNNEGRRAHWLPPEERDEPGVAYSEEYHRDVRRLIESVEDDAVVFTGWCHLYPYCYVAYVEQGRTGIEIIHDYPTKGHDELADSVVAYVARIKQDVPPRPIYFTHTPKNIATLYEFEEVYDGLETLYRVGSPIRPD